MGPGCLPFDEPVVKKVSAAVIYGGNKVPFIGIGTELMVRAVMLDKLAGVVG